MALYMLQASFTAEAVAAQIKAPRDRIEALRPVVEAAGGKIVGGGFPMGEFGIVLLVELPDDITATSYVLASIASGVPSGGKATRLLSGQEWVESLQQAPSHHIPIPQ